MDFNGVNASSTVNTNIEISMQDFIVTSDENVEARVDLIFTTILEKNLDVQIIDEIKQDESRFLNTYSMVIYLVKPGDTLWKIAKKFGSTIEEIARINGIEIIDKINVGEQLFIPRYNA